MSHARDLLTLLLASSSSGALTDIPLAPGLSSFQRYPALPNLSPSTLSVTNVSKPTPITSVAAFNSQLNLSAKDFSLRKAGVLFRDSADAMKASADKNEKYWHDALQVKSGNWGLTAAPLPYGGPQTQGRGGDKTAKDFMICFGLEDGDTSTLYRE